MKTSSKYSCRHRLLAWAVWGLLAVTLPASLLAQIPKWKFIAVGDTRGTSTSDSINTTIVQELAAQIVQQGAEFVIVPGDLVYSGSLSAFQNWKSLMAPVYQAGIGVYPVVGNHDLSDVPSFIQVFGPDLPDNGPVGEVNRTYGFALDNVLILALDNYVTDGRVNQAWVDSVLATNTRPHVFTFGHEPAFKANHVDCLDDYPANRDAFWNSLRNAGSRAYFCGHDHFYDHMRVGDGDADPANDLHQLIVGCGGAPFHTSYAYDGVNTTWTPQNVYHAQEYGYTVVEVDGLTVTMTFYHRTGANRYAPTSDVWTYTVGAPPPPQPPDPPTGLAATAGDARVTLNWNASAGATSYNVKRATGNPAGPYTTIASGVTATTYTDTGVINGTTYYYVVTAVNDAGESASSTYVGATPQQPVAPPAPTNLQATAGKRQIKLAWSASSGATSYNVKRSTINGGPYTTVRTGLTGTSFTNSKLTSGTTYYYVVTAVNASGESPNSNQASAAPR